MSLLRKILSQGLFSSRMEGITLHPLGSNCVAVENTVSGKTFLVDNLGRRKEYISLEAALETSITKRKFLLGEE